MKGILYYYYKSVKINLMVTIGLSLFYYIFITITCLLDSENSEYINLALALPIIFLLFFPVNAATGSLAMKESLSLKTILSGPVSQKKALQARYIFVGIVTICALVLSIILIIIFKLATYIEIKSVLKMISIIFGIRVIMSAFEVPMFHIFNKKTAGAIIFSLFIIIAFAIILIFMFVDLEKVDAGLHKIYEVITYKYSPSILIAGGAVLTYLLYLPTSKKRLDID